jgi:hypothetical protein
LRGPSFSDIGPPYTAGPPIPFSSYPTDLDAVDLDGDGTIDLVLSFHYGLWVMQGFGDGYFRAPKLYGFAHGAITYDGFPYVFADRNGDGRVDFTYSAGPGIGVALQRECLPAPP